MKAHDLEGQARKLLRGVTSENFDASAYTRMELRLMRIGNMNGGTYSSDLDKILRDSISPTRT
jgi:hypothetical protein